MPACEICCSIPALAGGWTQLSLLVLSSSCDSVALASGSNHMSVLTVHILGEALSLVRLFSLEHCLEGLI